MLAVSSGTQLGGQPLVTLDFPAPLQQRVVNALKADAKTVDLRAQAAQFYSLGVKVLDLFEDEDLADVLIEVKSADLYPFPMLICHVRRSRSAPLKLLTMRTTIEVLWPRVQISCEAWMKPNVNFFELVMTVQRPSESGRQT